MHKCMYGRNQEGQEEAFTHLTVTGMDGARLCVRAVHPELQEGALALPIVHETFVESSTVITGSFALHGLGHVPR